jgi:hypothetical protein
LAAIEAISDRLSVTKAEEIESKRLLEYEEDNVLFELQPIKAQKSID